MLTLVQFTAARGKAKTKAKGKGKATGKRGKKTFTNVEAAVAGPSRKSLLVVQSPVGEADPGGLCIDVMETPTPAAPPVYGSIQLLDGTNVIGAWFFTFRAFFPPHPF